MNWTVGVDVSKAKLDVALLKAGGKCRSKVFANNEAGFIQLLQWIQANVPLGEAGVQVHVCMEATGSYHEALALFLFDHGVSVVNPLLVKRFIEVDRVRNKTDQGDAKALIAYASLAPLIRQSGTSLNKHKGTHPQGNRELKSALYFPAMVAGKYNPLVAAF